MFANAKDGFALATLNGTTYPAASVNGGKTWRIDGPHFHVSAANAPDAVSRLGAAGHATYFAYGGPEGGESIVVSTDAGKRWWRAYMPGVPMAVVYGALGSNGGRGLLAFVRSGGSKILTYTSADGGKHWRYK